MVGWHHRFNGREFEQTLGDGEEQGSLACCSPWGCKESDVTEQLSTHSYIHKADSLSYTAETNTTLFKATTVQ